MFLYDNQWKFRTFSIRSLWNRLSAKRRPFTKKQSFVIRQNWLSKQKNVPLVACKTSIKSIEAVAQGCSVKSVLKNVSKFTGKHLCQSLVFNKVAGLLKKRLWHRYFAVNFVKFSRISFYKEYLRWLLVQIGYS